MPKYRCQSCGETFHGWAKQKSCQFCGGVLQVVTEEEGVAIKVDTKEIKGIKKRRKTIEPCGTITPTSDFFSFRSRNIGVFPKGSEKG